MVNRSNTLTDQVIDTDLSNLTTTVNNLNTNAITTAGTGLQIPSANTLAIDSTVVTLNGAQILSSKTLTSPIISTISNTGTLTLPTSTDTLVGKSTFDVLVNKTLTSPFITQIETTSSVITLPTGGGITNFVTDNSTSTLTNKTITAPNISSIFNTGLLTLPTATTTLIGTNTTDVLTNKSISGATNTLSNIPVASLTGAITVPNGGTGVATLTSGTFLEGNGTGSVITTKVIPTGAVVGTTDTQTLSSKTISGASNTLSNIATSSLTGVLAAGLGGTGNGSLTSGRFLQGNGVNPVIMSKVVPAGDVVGTTDTQTLSSKTMGDALNAGTFKIINLGTPTLDTDATTKLYVDTLPKTFFTFGSSANIANNSFMGSVNTATTATEAACRIYVPYALTLKNFRMYLDAAPGAGNNRVFTIRKNGVATAIVITIIDANTSGTDLVNTVVCVAGDFITLSCVNNGANNARGYGTLEY